MSKKLISWGILGTSPISKVMASAIQTSSHGQLLAIGSRDLAQAQDFANKFSIPKFYDNYQKLLNDDEIDVIYIGLPNHLHKEWIIKSALAGKHILCEKPLVLNSLEMDEVIQTVTKANVFCMEGLMYRYHPFTDKLQELVQQKIIGDIKLYNATYTANIATLANPIAGGAIRNLGCYPVSLVRLLAQAEPITIQGTGRLNADKIARQASALLKFADQSVAVISTADDIEMYFQFDIYGTNGCIKVISNPWLPKMNNKCIIYPHGESAMEINLDSEIPLYTYQIDTLNKKIMQNDFSNISGLNDSLGNVKVLEQWASQLN